MNCSPRHLDPAILIPLLARKNFILLSSGGLTDSCLPWTTTKSGASPSRRPAWQVHCRRKYGFVALSFLLDAFLFQKKQQKYHSKVANAFPFIIYCFHFLFHFPHSRATLGNNEYKTIPAPTYHRNSVL